MKENPLHNRIAKRLGAASRFTSAMIVALVVSTSLATGQESLALSLEAHIPLANVKGHIDHFSVDPGSQCVTCHMPAIETEGVPGAFVHAHTFRFISPAMTDKYKIPNPCASCHKDKSTTWAEDAMRHWPEYSAWRPAF